VPYSIASLQYANEQFGPLEGFRPDEMLALVEGIETVAEGLTALGALGGGVVSDGNADGLRELLADLPPSLDQMILAALRSALRRGLRTQVTWKPGYDFELQAWESSDGDQGLLNLLVISPHPREVDAAVSS
jgi:hypothetical protein